ncbi:MAG: M20/M25/M40 family metallo-hydrolase [Marinicaulis sp.]|nr:M20/M25/M40 family metallo-hydrolase [Marinicaulis sp.]NNL88647.1 M20/M25/M40 family metallo-hydrolase [Marinicaulis sp.]
MSKRQLVRTALVSSAVMFGNFASAAAQSTAVADAVSAADQYISENAAEILTGFAELLSIPNDAYDAENIRRNAAAISDLFAERNFSMELLEYENAPPLIYGLRETTGAARTIAIYVHYDGQPVDPEEWTDPPFEPALYDGAKTDGGTKIAFPAPGEKIDEDWRMYARSAGDDKAPIPALLAAIDALDDAGVAMSSNIILVFDGEEERGSDHLDEFLATYADKFEDIDLWLFCDGPIHQSGTPQLVFGVRGVTGMDITVYGPNRGLHSGHYGNWAPGPGWRLVNLLASMKNEDGDVLIEGFYDSTTPINAAELDAIRSAPDVDKKLRKQLGLAKTEANNALLAERILKPALNLKGLKSANVGDKARNIIPPEAMASIGLRLVKGNDPEDMLDLVEAHIERQGYVITREDPDEKMRRKHSLIAKITRNDGYPAMRSEMDDPAFEPLIDALSAVSDELILTPTLGGSLPLYMFETASDAPLVILPISNHDNNQHAADENIRIGALFYGVRAYAALLTMPQ